MLFEFDDYPTDTKSVIICQYLLEFDVNSNEGFLNRFVLKYCTMGVEFTPITALLRDTNYRTKKERVLALLIYVVGVDLTHDVKSSSSIGRGLQQYDSRLWLWRFN